MDLALAMGRTVRELMDSLESAEYTDWLAYGRIRPVGESAQDWHFATLKTLIANQWRRSKDKPIGPEKLLLAYIKPEKPVEELTPEEVREQAQKFMQALAAGME